MTNFPSRPAAPVASGSPATRSTWLHRVVTLALGTVLFIVNLSATTNTTQGANNDHRPNVLFIMTDDQAPTGTSHSGNPELQTPHIDRIFREGTTLKNAFVTTPVCSPARVGYLSSQYGTDVGITDWINPQAEQQLGLDPSLPAWPRHFAQAGYRTGLIGKWHLGTQDRFHPSHFGYDYFMGFREGGNSVKDPTLEVDGQTKVVPGLIVDILTDDALKFIEQHQSEPFLLSLHYRAPHSPWRPVRDEDAAPYNDLDPTLPDPDFPGLDVERVKQMTRDYYASIASVDRNVGRILDLLDRLQLADNTIVIFTSDHGYNVGHHGLWYKGNAHWMLKELPPQRWPNIDRRRRPNLFDQALRVPAAIRWPAHLRAGSAVDQLVTNLDWYPTLLAAASLADATPNNIRGRSFLPLLEGKSLDWNNGLYAEYDMKHGATTRMRAWRTPAWKLIVDFANEGRDELYDLESDPDEKNNVIDSQRAEHVVAKNWLRAELESHLAKLSPTARPVARRSNVDGHLDKSAGAVTAAVPFDPAGAQPRWWKGNLHTHSFWSDGNDFPEMIADWYFQQGYNFLALSDHNTLSEGSRWMAAEALQQRGGGDVIAKYLTRYGEHWVEHRFHPERGNIEVRLKPLNEFRALVEQRDHFIMLNGEEISDQFMQRPVHMNASNIKSMLRPVGGSSVREVIANNLRAVQEQEQETGRPILMHVNHPNFGYAVTAEDLAFVEQEHFFEVYNGHNAINHLGDASHMSIEQMWDVANTIRLQELDAHPLFGIATDDSHHYHRRGASRPGRGWVMVRSRLLTPESLIHALRAGNFYASSGVELRDVAYDADTRELRVEVNPVDDTNFVIEFIGTRRTTTPRPADAALRTPSDVPAGVGEVFARVEGTTATFVLTGDELYVRAVVTADRPPSDPSFEGQRRQAWTQPVGW
ncbi:MAG: sulfatase-like hydrolase/transferase [Planctomycetales bacterium]|nr:sulfatase-like hydrolase/transferase [Planctomycetales bacterium]